MAQPHSLESQERVQGHAWQVHLIQQAAGSTRTACPFVGIEVLGNALQDLHW